MDHNERRKDVTWKTCTLREWLNKDFLEAAFTGEERARILETEVRNDGNPVYGTTGGDNTRDRVFLLSLDEAVRYFQGDEERRCKATPYAVSQGARVDDDGFCCWWLRSPGLFPSNAAFVSSVGSLNPNGHYVHNDFDALRQSLWINL